MANKYWWEEDNEQTTSKSTSQTKSNSSSQSSKKYWWEEDSEKSSSGLWWDDGTTAKTIGSNVSSRVNEWLNSHNSYISDYQSRYADRKFGYEDSFVSDSADWLAKAKERKSGFDTEAESILSYLDQYSGYLDADWVNKVKKTITDAQKSQGAILDSYTKDNEWWSGFGSEEMVQKYGSAEEAYKYHQRSDGYSKKYAGQTSDQLSAILDSMEDGEEKDWLASYKGSVYHDEMLKYDTATAESDIATLEQIMEDYIHADWYHSVTQAHPEATIDSDGQALLARYEEYRQKYGSMDDLEKRIQRMKLDLAYAKRNQRAAELAAVADSSSANYDPDFGKYSGYVDDGKTALIPDYKDLAYDAVNGNVDGMNQGVGESFGTSPFGLLGVGLQGGEKERLDSIKYMKDDERSLYNYYYSKHGYEAAEAYLDSIIDTLNQRQGEAMFKPMENKWLLEEVFGIAAGLDQFNSGLRNLFSTKDYIPTSATQYASGMVREDLKDNGPKLPDWMGGASLGQGAYDFITTTANMAPSILASTVVGAFNPAAGAAVGNVLMGASATGNAYQEALNLGYDKGQARAYSTLVGASEVGLQYLLGGIGKLGGKLSGKAATSLASKFDNAYARLAVKYGMNMLSEGGEEYLQEVLTPVFKNLALGTDEEINLISEDAIYSFLIGALSSGFMEGTGISSDNGKSLIGNLIDMSSKNEANIKAATMYGETEVQKALIKEGLASDVDSESRQLAEMFKRKTDKGKSMTGYEIRQQVAANEAQFVVENYEEALPLAKQRLTELGETKNVDKIANLVAKRASGQTLTPAEKSTLVRSQYGAKVAKEMSPSNDPNQTYKSLEKRVGTESHFGVSESGQATIQESNEAFDIKKAEVVSFTTDKATGEITDVTFKTEGGTEVQASGIDFADSDQSYLVDAVSKIENITPDAATVAVHSYDPSTGQTVGEYLNGFDEAYTYGYNKYPEADLKAGNFTHKLTNEQMMTAYQLGQSAKKISGENKVQAIKRMRTASQAAVEKAIAEGNAAPNTNGLTITYNKGGGNVVSVDEANAKDAQTGAIEVAKVLHKLGLGTRVELFSSYITKDEHGNKIRVFRDDNGVEQRAYSGVYRKSDGTIRIDLNAYNGKGLTLYALSHELTHFIQQWSTEKYEALADFLVKTYEGTDMTMHDRVVKEQARLGRIRRKGVSYSEAYDEVVANAMSKMFDDGKLVEKLAKLKEQDKTLAQKLWEGFKEIMSKFMGFYQNEALFQDADVLVDMKETFEKLQDLFAEALVEASDNFQASHQIGLEIDTATESVSPAVMYSEHTWTESDYVQERDKAAKEIAKAIGVSEKKAKDYIDSINSIAKMIAEDRSRLDYFSSPGRSSFVDNAEYGGSFDFSTLCKKRRLLTGTFTAIQKALPNTALTADEILDIRNRMKKANLEVSCGLCYVEGSRANMGQFAKEFLRLYKQYYPDAWQPNMADVNTPDGIEWVRINHPECYEQYEYFWNHYGTLKEGDKNLFASQQKPKLYQLHTEYKGEILNKFKNDDKVEDKNLNGGIRLQSFSDFEIVHLIDTMQIIMDMSRVGLAGQAYTKVPDFAWALGDTGLKINLSLIAKGVDANGKLIFDDVEGMPISEAMKLRDRYSKNVGTILVAFNDEQLLAAMADDRVDFIIPFHRSQWKKSQYEAMGLPAKTKDYTFMQNEKYIKPQFHEYRGRMVKDKATNYMPNEYWDFSKSGKENAEAYLEMCARNNKRPKFYKLLQNNGDGSYSLKVDGSTDGYWKLLIDFKMYDNDGNGSRQMPVKPEFNMEEANRMLETYKGGHSNFPVAQGIVDGFVKDYKASHKGEQYSEHDTDFDKDFDYSGLNWASDLGIITGKDRAIFERTINNEIFRGAKPQSANGEYIIDTGKCLMFTDGDFHRPTLSRVIVFVTEYESLLDEAKRRILYEAGSTGDVQVSQRIIENLYGPGFAVEYTPEIHGAYAWQNGRGERTNGKGSGRGYHAKSLKERFAEEGLSHLLEDDDEVYSEHETDYSNRSLLANAFEGITNGSDEYKLIQKYKGYIAELNSLEEKLSEMNAQIRKIRFGKGEYDAEKLARLESEAKKIAEAISKYDQYLLSLEASEPLRKVIERERKKEAQKTRDHVKEIQQNKKVRAEQTEYRHKIRRVIRDLDKLLNRGNKKQNVKEDMKGFVSKALELADYLFTDHISNDELIRRGIDADLVTASGKAQLVKETEDILTKLYDEADSLTDEEFTRLDDKRKANEAKMKDLLTAQRNRRLDVPVYQLFNDLVTEYAILKNSKQDAVKAAYSDEVERLLRTFLGDADSDRAKALQNMRVADMTTEELWKLYNAYTMVLTTVRDANKFHVKGMTETIEQVVGKIAGDFSSRKIPEKKLAIAAQKLANKIGWDYEKLYYALDRIGSDAFTKLFMNLAESENIVMQDIMEAIAFRDEIVAKYGFNNWDVNKKIDREFLDNTGKKFKLTLGELMSLYAYSRREGAWDHIEYGGFAFGKDELTNPNPADTYKLSKEQCEAITGLLTKEQKAYVEDMQKFLSETMGEKGNEVSMQLYGIKMFGEKNYFPLHIYGVFKAQAQESEAKDKEGFTSMSNAGFTHAQNPNAKAPFVLEGFNEVWSDHVNEMSRYHGTVPALEDIRRVMNRSSYSESAADSTSIKQLMINKFGKDAANYFDNLYREANSGAITDKLQKTSKKLLSLFRKNSVAYSLSVLVQQPASIVRAYAMIDKKYFGLKGFGTITSGVANAVSDKWTKAHTNAYNEMLKYAPGVTMAKEIGGFDTATGGSIRSTLLDTKKSLKQKWNTGTALEKGKAVLDVVDDNAIANLPNLADKIAWIEIWNACKRETVAKHKDLSTSSDEFLQIVGDRFTEVIRATQVYDSIFAKSPMMKSKNLAVQYLVSFMNEPNTVANMVESAIRNTIKGDWKQGAKTAAVVVHGIVFTSMLKSLIYAMRDDDEDETYIEKYIEAMTGSMMDDFNVLNYIPIARDVWSLAQGYDVERADMAIVSDFLDAVNKVVKNATTDKEDMTEEELIEFDKKVTEANWKLVESIASFFGIPVKNIRREINAVIDHAKIASANAGKTTAQSTWDTIYEAVIDSLPDFLAPKAATKADKLYEAIISGDKAYLTRLKSTYVDKDGNFDKTKYESAVVKALRENDSRIRAAAQAGVDGNSEERSRIYKVIKTELGAEYANQIIAAITDEANDIRNEGKPDKVTGQYEAYDFVKAVSADDAEAAKTARDDIIATYKANGKTPAEAEKAFISDVKSGIEDAYSYGELSRSEAESMLVEYADMEEEDAAGKVTYWDFSMANPNCDLSEARVLKYLEFAEPAGVSLDMYEQFVANTKDLSDIKDEWGDVEVSEREQVLEVIDSLPLTWQQKDALYLAHGYSENTIWDVPW